MGLPTFYEENLERARSCQEADVAATVRALFRQGDPANVGTPAPTAFARKSGDFFGGLGRAPDVPMDTSVMTDVDCCAYVAALERNGFFGPDSWYMNAARNIEYAKQARDGGKLSLPTLFLHGTYDFVCETTTNSRLADPMRPANNTSSRLPIRPWSGAAWPPDRSGRRGTQARRALLAFAQQGC